MKSEIEVPDGWEIKNVNDLFHVKNGTTPSTKKMSYWENGSINWFTPADLSKLKEKKHVTESKRKITKDALDKCNLTLMPQNSLILSCRAPVGYVAILNEKSTFNQGCKGLIAKSPLVNYTYYLYCLLYSKKKLQAISGGSTFKELSKSAFLKFIVLYPPFEEQQKIADILSKVDEQIDFTGKIIDKTEELKKGLMQKLLTKGIGHAKFKKTELGEIPEKWDIIKQGDVVKFINGRAYKLSEWEKSGIPVIRLQNLTGSGTTFYYSNLKLDSKQYVEDDDLLYMWSASFGPYIWHGPKAIYHYHIWKIICGEKIDKMFMFYNLYKITNIMRNQMHGMAMLHITKAKMEGQKIILPPIDEQKQIVTILSKVDEQITDNKKELENLKELKKGLMQDLLTGKVRVTT